MTYTILSARYANAEQTAIVLETKEAGAVMTSQADTPELWAQATAGQVQAYQAPVQRITVPRLRFKLELAERGLLASVNEAVQQAGDVAQLYWAEATEFESDHALVQQIGQALALDAGEIREIFVAASNREA